MPETLEYYLDEVARRGSWNGGGSVAASAAALSAALLEKLSVDRRHIQKLRRIRRACLALCWEDGRLFARAIAASAQRHPRSFFLRALARATESPCRVLEYSGELSAIEKQLRRAIRPAFQSDLRCAAALNEACRISACVLIETNLLWMGKVPQAAGIRRRLASAGRRGHVPQ
ncbi:MAG: cyclodeaminase/cyclohydrolase family protein [Candidatus Omnitrophica bacterium]|nr:cyclodeaminase/cyclohydrolase family protein [Candidatus Omnitrophota bacterium]MBI3010399.1 cyclodeaminase/cyclohydrolase family protein [Candidatus Omnitrophota bacterium]